MRLHLTRAEILAAIRRAYPVIPKGAQVVFEGADQGNSSLRGVSFYYGEQDTGNEAGGSPQISGGSQGPAEPRSLEGDTIAAAVDGYLAQKRTEGVSDSHWKELHRVLQTFCQFSGHWAGVPAGTDIIKFGVRVHAVNRPMVLAWRDDIAGGRSITTVNHWLGILGGFLRWCAHAGLRGGEDIVSGLRLKQSKSADTCRKAFTPDQVDKVFGQALVEATDPFFPERWIPLLALWCGLRPSEAAQLHLTSIRKISLGVVIDLSPDKINLKTPAARRTIPVPATIADNLWAFRPLAVEARGRMFPTEMRTSRPGFHASRWFNEKYLRGIAGITDPKLTLYSARHTYATALKQNGVAEPLIAELMGHANPSITTGRYGKRYDLEQLFEAVKVLPFPNPWRKT